MAVSIPWAAKTLPAIVETLRGGQSAGTALAGALFGATADPPLQPAMFNLVLVCSAPTNRVDTSN